MQFSVMELMMFIGNDLIESIPLEESRISKPGYVGHFKRALKTKYHELIQQFSQPPEFFVLNHITQTHQTGSVNIRNWG